MRWLWLPMLVLFAVLSIDAVRDGTYWLAAAYAVVGLAVSYWLCPWQGGRTLRHEEVSTMAEEDRPVVVYWRPGCGYCMRLKATLGDLGDKALWVNIWQDDDAAAFVRSVNDGNEVVPTVVIDGEPHTNPDPTDVRERLAARS
ncbi:glutaredoxin domain-containing protein [Ornithinimicrobium cavernae]|uniref:glutaredoxin domain-containing protein n=1 Tax=Ornithinimicrobium cavernae TaxID=2666047 RepID=UPI001F3B7D84|nr:glutaredoxin domain-containing protein [Ornithinimicrobium cavernae]